MFQPSEGGKGAVAWRKRGAGGFSVPCKQHNEDTVHVETSLIWKAPAKGPSIRPELPSWGKDQDSSPGHSQAAWDR